MRRGVGKYIGDDAQRRFWRIDVGVAHHEFFEDVVLDGASEFFRRHALLFGGGDIERQHREHGAVHGHRHRHLIERNAGKQRAHVVDRIDGDARHADVAGDARMIAVVAAMGGEVESDRQAFLPGGEIAPVERIGILGRREAGILPDGPRLGDVHGRVGAAQKRRDARVGIEAVQAVERGGVIGIFDVDALGRLPRLSVQRCRRRRAKRVGITDLRKVRDAAHTFIRSALEYRKRRPVSPVHRSPRK